MRSAGSGGYMAIQFVYPIYLYITVCIHGFNMVMRYGLDAVGVLFAFGGGVCRSCRLFARSHGLPNVG